MNWLLLILAALAAGCGRGQAPAAAKASAPPAEVVSIPERPTFTRDIAPVVFQNCASCHRPGQSAPFSLLTYEDAQKRAKQIAEVTGKGYMPPWLPEKGYGEFAHERRLTAGQIALIAAWVRQGAPEGAAGDLPPLPKFTDDWQLGPPDLVIKMEEPFELPAEGRDVYRNFVIPIPLSGKRYVEAFEFQPGNRRIAHHAFMRIDRTRQSRLLDAQAPGPGFPGMDSPPTALSPDGHILSWQPGKVPSRVPPGLAWTLEKGSDLILQMHMHPSGKPEAIQSSIAFYFTDIAPTNTPFKISLNSFSIDIPAGEKNYLVEDSYVLPVDVDLLGILPHAHYLAKELEGFAILPDGTKKWLLRIPDWDFNWQGDYRYAQPVFLPKGTSLRMRFRYDNSSDNIRNPNSPPVRVQYGVQSTDEMGELWFQVLPRNRRDLAVLTDNFQGRSLKDIVAYNYYRLRLDPGDPRAHNNLGKAFLTLGKQKEAGEQLAKAVELDPNYDEAHYNLGLLRRIQNKLPQAAREFQLALQFNPEHAKAAGNLGLIYMQENRPAEARGPLEKAVELNPEDAIALDTLGVLYFNEGNAAKAEEHFRKALAIDPQEPSARQHLELILKAKAGK